MNENEAYELAEEEAGSAIVTCEDEEISYTGEAPLTEPEIEEEHEDECTEDSEEDLATLKSSFPELSGIEALEELPSRYKELRLLGLTPEEAYLAAAKRHRRDTRAHLSDSFPRPASAPSSSMTRRELCAARELFKGLGDAEIIKLYKRVSG